MIFEVELVFKATKRTIKERPELKLNLVAYDTQLGSLHSTYCIEILLDWRNQNMPGPINDLRVPKA